MMEQMRHFVNLSKPNWIVISIHWGEQLSNSRLAWLETMGIGTFAIQTIEIVVRSCDLYVWFKPIIFEKLNNLASLQWNGQR